MLFYHISSAQEPRDYTTSEIEAIIDNKKASEGDLYYDKEKKIYYLGLTNGLLLLLSGGGESDVIKNEDGDSYVRVVENGASDSVLVGLNGSRMWAFVNNRFESLTPDENTFIGNKSGVENKGGYNVAVGNFTLQPVSKGNSALGFEAGQNNNSSENVFIGLSAGKNTRGAQGSIFIGSNAGRENENGVGNTFIGTSAGEQSNATSSIHIGSNTGAKVAGDNNIFMGYQAATNQERGSDNILIGSKLDLPNLTGSNQLNIGNLLYGVNVADSAPQLDKGRLSVGVTEAEESAKLEIKSSNKGILIPRMTTDQRTSIDSPANGLLVYDTDTGSFWSFKEKYWAQTVSGLVTLNPNNSGAPYEDSYLLQVSDNGSILEFNSDSDVKLVVEPGLPPGFQVSVTQLGLGNVYFVGDAGAVVKHPYDFDRTSAQYSKAGIEIASDGTIILSGDVTF